MIIKITATMTAKIRRTVMILPTMLSARVRFRLQSLAKSPVGHRSAEAGKAVAKNTKAAKPKENKLDLLFILFFMIVRINSSCQYLLHDLILIATKNRLTKSYLKCILQANL
jgi:hypothetical protein